MFINKPLFNPNQDPDNGGATGAEVEAAEFQSFIDKGEDKLTDEEKVKYNQLKEKYVVEETDEDGKPLTAEAKRQIQEIETKVKAIQAKPEKDRSVEEIKYLQDNTEEIKRDVYEEVDEITGYPIKLDYGKVDPKSSEGIAKREMYIREVSQKEYDATLKERFPRAYNFMNHLANGGKEEDFFKTENKDFLSINLTKTDVASQESIYRQALSIRGNKPEQIEALVKIAKDKGNLYEESKSELEALQSKQKLDEDRKAEQEEREGAEYQKAVTTFYGTLQQQIEKGINGNAIPIPERRNFLKFIADNTIYRDGKFTILKDVDTKNIEKELALEWFKYKGGDLKALVEKKAESVHALKIKSRIKTRVVPKASAGGDKRFVSLGEL